MHDHRSVGGQRPDAREPKLETRTRGVPRKAGASPLAALERFARHRPGFRFVTGPGLLAFVVLAIVCGPGAEDAGAQTMKAQGFKPARPAGPVGVLPPAPPLPAECAKSPPTKDQCADANWYATNKCVTDKATKQQMLDYCTWVFKKEWHLSGNQGHVQLFPTSAPSAQYPIITPARKIDRAKSVEPRPAPRPTGKRHFAGEAGPAANKPKTGGAALGSAKFTPSATRPGGGGYTSAMTAHTAVALAGVDKDIDSLEFVNATDPVAIAAASRLQSTLLAKPAWLTSGPAVNGCMEYAYKRFGGYSDYSAAAKRLGRNYRQIYAIATDPASPTNIDKGYLMQTGTNVPMPLQMSEKMGRSFLNQATQVTNYTISIPKNAFLSIQPTWLQATQIPPGLPITVAQRDEIMAKIRTQGGRPTSTMSIAGLGTPVRLHKEAKARFDSVYGNPHDDELSDIARRTKAYQDLAARRQTAVIELSCAAASDPCFKCSAPPNIGGIGKVGVQFPAVLQKIRERVTGDPVINPADLGARLQPGTANTRVQSLIDMNATAPAFVDLERQLGLNGFNQNAIQGGSGFKMKAAPDFGQVKAGTNTPGNGISSNTVAPGGQCVAELAAQGAALRSEIANAEKTLTRLLINELSYGNRSCLADPGSGNVNICDWSYEMFAADTVTALDSEVEKAFRECQAEVTNAAVAAPYTGNNAFTAILKTVERQKLVFPCAARKDFAVDAPSAGRFMELNANVMARYCEVYRQNTQITQNKNAIAGEMAGVKWNPSAGEIYDSSVDSLDMGSRDSLGASFEYEASWKLKRNSQNPYLTNGDVSSTCRFEGNTASKTGALIHFFGEDLELFSLRGGGAARIENNAPKVTTDLIQFTYYDFDQFKKVEKFTRPAGTAPANQVIGTTTPPIRLGGDEFDFWIWVGPVPLHVVFGFSVSAGLDYKFAANPGNNCSSMEGPSNFKLVSAIEPFIRADAYADASIDVVVAAAGVRLDLLLLRLGIPLSANVDHSSGNQWRFSNGGRVTIDMLSGRLTAYAEVGVAPLEESWEAEIFGWDGFHANVASWGLEKTISNATMRTALAGTVTADSVTCDCVPASAGTQYCCSMVPCANQNVPGCQGAKSPNGTLRACTFNQADYQRILNAAQSTVEQGCKAFVLP